MLVVHIGTPKTGSKALQSFLFRNSKELAKQGIRYLKSGRRSERRKRLTRSHSELVKLLKGPSERDAWKDLRAELDRSTCHTNVMSAEGFWFGDPVEMRAELPKSQSVRFVVYLRRQDKYLQSLWKQTVAGGRKYSFNEWRRRRPTRGDYLSTVEKWADMFGAESILIRPYEKGGEINTVQDFADVLGVKGAFDIENIGRNPSPRRELTHLIRAFNDLDLNSDVDHHQLYRAIIAKSESYIRTCDMLSYTESVALMEEHAEGNKILIEKYYRGHPIPLFPELAPFESEGTWDMESKEFLQLVTDVLEVLIDFATSGKISVLGSSADSASGNVDEYEF